MKWLLTGGLLTLFVVGFGLGVMLNKDPASTTLLGEGEKISQNSLVDLSVENEQLLSMKITSTAFEDNQSIPPQYTCDGDNGNPPLAFEGVSDEVETLVLIVDDPDAPEGTWIHWTLWNIPADAAGINAGSIPESAEEGETSYGKSGYDGPCPPTGEHKYVFKLYGLDIALTISPQSTKEDLEEAMTGHVIEKAELVGLYRKQN